MIECIRRDDRLQSQRRPPKPKRPDASEKWKRIGGGVAQAERPADDAPESR